MQYLHSTSTAVITLFVKPHWYTIAEEESGEAWPLPADLLLFA